MTALAPAIGFYLWSRLETCSPLPIGQPVPCGSHSWLRVQWGGPRSAADPRSLAHLQYACQESAPRD